MDTVLLQTAVLHIPQQHGTPPPLDAIQASPSVVRLVAGLLLLHNKAAAQVEAHCCFIDSHGVHKKVAYP